VTSAAALVAGLCLLVLAASIPLIAQLRSLEEDRAHGRATVAMRIGPTATRVLYSTLVVSAYVILPIAWGLGAIPTGALGAFLTAPLAMRLGDVVSHRSGEALSGARREAVLLLAGFAALLLAGAAVLP
jgi:1,4-dihydroxy-2-naphthoate octaprenyltransferase